MFKTLQKTVSILPILGDPGADSGDAHARLGLGVSFPKTSTDITVKLKNYIRNYRLVQFHVAKVCNTYILSNTHSEDLSKRIIIDDNVIFNSRSKESLTKQEKRRNFVYTFEVID